MDVFGIYEEGQCPGQLAWGGGAGGRERGEVVSGQKSCWQELAQISRADQGEKDEPACWPPSRPHFQGQHTEDQCPRASAGPFKTITTLELPNKHSLSSHLIRKVFRLQ